MVHNIHNATHPLTVRAVNGSSIITKKAYFGTHPIPVWFYPPGKVNILLLHNMQKFYRYTIDTRKSNSINMHMSDGNLMKFKATDFN